MAGRSLEHCRANESVGRKKPPKDSRVWSVAIFASSVTRLPLGRIELTHVGVLTCSVGRGEA